MAIDIYVQTKMQAPRHQSADEWIAGIEDTEFWALATFVEKLRQRTGQHIDLYDAAAFGSFNLEALKTVSDETKSWLAAQPKSWPVSLGFQLAPQRQEITRVVQRQTLQKLLDAIDAATEKARLQNGVVTFWGD